MASGRSRLQPSHQPQHVFQVHGQIVLMVIETILDRDDPRVVEQDDLLQGSGNTTPLPAGSGAREGTTRSQRQRESAIPVEPVPAIASKTQHPPNTRFPVPHPVGTVKKAALAGEPAAACIKEQKRQDTEAGDRDDYCDHCQPHAQNIALYR